MSENIKNSINHFGEMEGEIHLKTTIPQFPRQPINISPWNNDIETRARIILDYDPDYPDVLLRVVKEPIVIDLDDIYINNYDEEQLKEFADKVVFFTGTDYDKREISIIIPKNSPQENPGLYTVAEKEKMIIEQIRPMIREML